MLLAPHRAGQLRQLVEGVHGAWAGCQLGGSLAGRGSRPRPFLRRVGGSQNPIQLLGNPRRRKL